MNDLIRKQTVLNMIDDLQFGNKTEKLTKLYELVKRWPSAQPEHAKYVPDTKAIPSSRDCVDLSERVTATFYDDEHEEWSQKTVTIRDVLDSVCDVYTVLPSAQPERKTGRWIKHGIGHENVPWGFDCSECGEWFVIDSKYIDRYKFCPNCGADMRGETDG